MNQSNSGLCFLRSILDFFFFFKCYENASAMLIQFFFFFYWKCLFNNDSTYYITINFHKRLWLRHFLHDRRSSPSSHEIYNVCMGKRKFTFECLHFKKKKFWIGRHNIIDIKKHFGFGKKIWKNQKRISGWSSTWMC